eukprot:259044_1
MRSVDKEDEADLNKLNKDIPTQDIVRIESNGIANGVLKFKLYGHLLSQGNWYPLIHSNFCLYYKQSTDWQSKPFSIGQIRKFPVEDFWHITVRVDTNLLDYTLQFKLGVLITDIEDHQRDEFPLNTLSYSNTVSVCIPSSMKPKSFAVNDIVNAKNPSTGRWKYALIKKKYDEQNLVYGRYDVSTISHHMNPNNAFTVMNTKSDKTVKEISVTAYIDLTSVLEMEYLFLIGNRNGIEEEDVRHLHVILSDIFHNEYAKQHEEEIQTTYVDVDYVSMAKFVSICVINCLWDRRDKGYKIKCLVGNEKDDTHFDEYLTLHQQRDYTVRRALESRGEKREQGTFWYCDLCFCRQGDYYWMFRCQCDKKVVYHG